EFAEYDFKHSAQRLDVPSKYLLSKAIKKKNGYDQLKRTMVSRTIYVQVLDFSITEEQIYQMFSKVGEVEKVIAGLNSQSQEPCGFWFIIFENQEGVFQAIKYLNQTKLMNHFLQIDLDLGFKSGREFGRGVKGG
ncbi:nuclear cap-binding protein subunit CBC2 ASCRUDRAFT_17687, partial [Ascoidea rubescens DSM 1968]